MFPFFKRKKVDVFEAFNQQIPWLSDEQLAALMDALETEAVNRDARHAGYYDAEMEVWCEGA